MRFIGTAVSPEQSSDAEVGGEVAKALEVVGGGEAVQQRERRRHPPRQRLVGGIAEERVQPEEPPGPALDLEQLTGQQLGIPRVPAVGDDEDDRVAVEEPRSPLPVEVGPALAAPRSPRPGPEIPPPPAPPGGGGA